MFLVVNQTIHHVVSSVLWLATGTHGERIWKSSRPLEAEKSAVIMGMPPLHSIRRRLPSSSLVIVFPSSDPAISSSSPPTSPVITTLSRPTVARASTSATLFHADIDFASLDPLRKLSTDNSDSADPMGCSKEHLRSRSVTEVEVDNFDKDLPIAPPTAVRWHRGKKRASKIMARWNPDPLERVNLLPLLLSKTPYLPLERAYRASALIAL